VNSLILSKAYKKFVVGFDIHGDKQDVAANKAFFKFVKLWRPEIRVCGGDLYDFRPLRKKADAEERRDSLQADFEAGTQWLEELKPQYFLLGNHDVRLWDLAVTSNGPAADYANQGIKEIEKLTAKLKCKILPYDRKEGVLQLGHLKMIHGFTSGVGAARKTAQVYGSVLMGHGHGIQHVAIEGVENRVGRMCGCLCQLDMDYVRASMGSLLWRHGWAYGVVNEVTGDYQVWQAEEINGNWILPTGLEVL
jgi:hypothetical protein